MSALESLERVMNWRQLTKNSLIMLCMFNCVPLLSVSSFGQQTTESPPLADTQRRLAERYDRLELLVGRLAELSRSTQPRRARLLRELIAKSREQDIAGRFEAILGDLQKDSLGTALTGQQGLQGDLQKLLDLLLQEDRDRQIESQRRRIGKYLDEIKKIIRLQRGIKARTEGGDQADKTAQDQQRAAKVVGKLQGKIEANEDVGKSKAGKESKSRESAGKSKPSVEQPGDGKGEPKDPQQKGKESSPGKPGEGQPQAGKPQTGKPQEGEGKQGKPSSTPSEGQPSEGQPGSGSPQDNQSQQEQQHSPMERAMERLKQAQQRMQQAKKKLEEAKREPALEKQEQALRELEQAKAELERILRQLREEELERMLVLLEARFRKMLKNQIAVYDETKSLAATEADAPAHELEIVSGRLRRREESIVHEADRALILLREDGTSVAFPVALEQTRDDMVTVAHRLGDVRLGVLTQGLEEDIIEALEETLDALQQALKELREQRSRQQKGKGQPGEQPLVDQLAELRMIRALQNRVNSRTQRYGKLLGDRQAMEEDLRGALAELARRQECIFEATRDLESGRNQ